ncbi:MAG TPA: discoidin domain-containing protein, partial [Spirochaetota bacterium]|nr:discoidin domain-containing protein [Spirochaetota bacterium]
MHRINVIRKYFYPATIAGYTSQLDDSHGPEHLLENDDSFWSSGKNNSIIPEYVTLDLHEQQAVNYIEIYPSLNGKNTFPSDFRIEYSNDGTIWQILCAESKFYFEEEEFYRLQTGLVHTRFIRVFITRPIKVGTRYFSELGQVRCGIAGAHAISASSTSSYEHETSMMLDDDHNSYWESEISSSTSRQSIDIDLGYVFSLNYISLLTPSKGINGFPEQFSIEVSADNNIWTPIIEEKRFRTEPETTYAWNTGIANARYIRIELNTTSIEKDTFG